MRLKVAVRELPESDTVVERVPAFTNEPVETPVLAVVSLIVTGNPVANVALVLARVKPVVIAVATMTLNISLLDRVAVAAVVHAVDSCAITLVVELSSYP